MKWSGRNSCALRRNLQFVLSSIGCIPVIQGQLGAVGCASDSLYVGHGIEPNQRALLFLRGRNFNLIAQYWFVPGTESNVISQSNFNKLRGLCKIDSERLCLMNGTTFHRGVVHHMSIQWVAYAAGCSSWIHSIVTL